jgi:F-type H+-transporting ATPase subunit gamma
MATLKEIRRRIVSVKNTQKITKAMKLVSAAKFARANAAIRGATPYGQAIDRLLAQVSASANLESLPVFQQRTESRILVMVVASDRGLCGALNTNVAKASNRFLREKAEAGVAIDLLLLGKKVDQVYGKQARGDIGKNILKLRNTASIKVVATHQRVVESPDFSFADTLAKTFANEFAEKYDAVYAVYPEFRSALSQNPRVDRILPIVAEPALADPSIPSQGVKSSQSGGGDYLVKPSTDEVVRALVSRQISNKVFRVILNAAASEHGARMTAMDSATNNAREVILKLTLDYNRGRQAAITTELIEITSGASAL